MRASWGPLIGAGGQLTRRKSLTLAPVRVFVLVVGGLAFAAFVRWQVVGRRRGIEASRDGGGFLLIVAACHHDIFRWFLLAPVADFVAVLAGGRIGGEAIVVALASGGGHDDLLVKTGVNALSFMVWGTALAGTGRWVCSRR